MNTYVHVNEIFDWGKPTVIEQRLDYAFGADGENFWEKFFFCDKKHFEDKDDKEQYKIIYLFTEYQLQIMWNWWNEKYEEGDKDVKKNLLYSKMKLFNSTKQVGGRNIDRINVCFVKHITGFDLEVKRLYFGAQPQEKKEHNYVDFFEGRFGGEPAGSVLTDKIRKDILLQLISMRPGIEKECDCIIERYETVKENKRIARTWMFYLGRQYTDIRVIDYCKIIKADCPLVQKIFP
jgi:hypothetical protein